MYEQFSLFRRKMQRRGRRVTPLLIESKTWSAAALSMGRFLADLVSHIKRPDESERDILERFVTWQIPSLQYEDLLISSGLRQSMRPANRETFLPFETSTGSEMNATQGSEPVVIDRPTQYQTTRRIVRPVYALHFGAGLGCHIYSEFEMKYYFRQRSNQPGHPLPNTSSTMSPLQPLITSKHRIWRGSVAWTT